jgi:hypothetical protein
MADFRTACLEDLVDRLRHDLHGRSALAERLETALTERDPELVARAMEELDQEPAPIRALVHDAILAWLFGGDPAAGLRVLPSASALPQ